MTFIKRNVKDNAEAQIKVPLSSTATSLLVHSGQASFLPDAPCVLTLNKRKNNSIIKYEKVKVSNREGDTLTIERGFGDTTPQEFSIDDYVSCFVTEDVIQDLQDRVQESAIDENVVHKSGDETIDGVKTFSSLPKAPSTSGTSDVATEERIEEKLAQSGAVSVLSQNVVAGEDLNSLDATFVGSGQKIIDSGFKEKLMLGKEDGSVSLACDSRYAGGLLTGLSFEVEKEGNPDSFSVVGVLKDGKEVTIKERISETGMVDIECEMYGVESIKLTTNSLSENNYWKISTGHKYEKITDDDILPQMESNNSPSGYLVTSSPIESSNYEPYKAFDGNSGSYWKVRSGEGKWIQIEGLSNKNDGTVATGWYIDFESFNDEPRRFQIDGSNDGINWTRLATVTNNHNTRPQGTFEEECSFDKYKLTCGVNRSSYLYVADFKIRGYHTESTGHSVQIQKWGHENKRYKSIPYIPKIFTQSDNTEVYHNGSWTMMLREIVVDTSSVSGMYVEGKAVISWRMESNSSSNKTKINVDGTDIAEYNTGYDSISTHQVTVDGIKNGTKIKIYGIKNTGRMRYKSATITLEYGDKKRNMFDSIVLHDTQRGNEVIGLIDGVHSFEQDSSLNDGLIYVGEHGELTNTPSTLIVGKKLGNKLHIGKYGATFTDKLSTTATTGTVALGNAEGYITVIINGEQKKIPYYGV